MRNFLFLLFLTTMMFSSFAQVMPDSSKHLSFKGVPIDGPLAEFISKMKKGGFTYKGKEDGVIILEGDFASYKNCVVGVSTLKQQDLVSHIDVKFPSRDTWGSLSSDYFTLKELLTEKYGKASINVENFQSRTPDDDRSKLMQVRFDGCKYYTHFETEKGTIKLSIEYNREKGCFVQLAYFDKINSETVKKQALDDL